MKEQQRKSSQILWVPVHFCRIRLRDIPKTYSDQRQATKHREDPAFNSFSTERGWKSDTFKDENFGTSGCLIIPDIQKGLTAVTSSRRWFIIILPYLDHCRHKSSVSSSCEGGRQVGGWGWAMRCHRHLRSDQQDSSRQAVSSKLGNCPEKKLVELFSWKGCLLKGIVHNFF